MARYLLDTNILVYVLLSEFDNISIETEEILNEYDNQLYTSSISVLELLQLYRIKKIQAKKYKTATELHTAIEKDFNIKIFPFTKEHTKTLSKLKIASHHNDPLDHAILSQAITEKLILVSSDKKFKEYTSQNLNFIFNKR
jgi:PIN domain nuclease of toxin-antitoxin system